MEERGTANSTGGVRFIYDGDCPLCRHAAHALRIRRDVGTLHLIDARDETSRAVIEDITSRGLDLDAGMVLVFRGRYYHGADALTLMSLLGSPVGWFNRFNALLFRSERTARLAYPAMRGIRNLLLRLLGVPPIDNLGRAKREPIFADVFGPAWSRLQPVMRRHYANRAFSHDVVTVAGTMEVASSALLRCLAPLMKRAGTLVPYEGSDIPVTVHFRSEPDSRAFCFDREFSFPGRPPCFFRSKMVPVGGNEVIEWMGWGIGWHAAYRYADGRIRLDHRGYRWRLFGHAVPIPLGLLFGTGSAEEEATADDRFRMKMEIRHPIFGVTYRYSGEFRVVEVAQHD